MNQEVRQYINRFSLEDQSVINELRKTILDHLPKGFEETLSYGMIGYVVPHTLYSKGYHVDPSLPLGLMAIAKQKHSFNFYHMGIYEDKDLFDWFKINYEAHYGKLDHGKSCLRFKSKEKIPFDLIGILVEKISVQQWIDKVESTLKLQK
jgi:uncharacterized protein YdhG (YjbR/CyaY superfamily)